MAASKTCPSYAGAGPTEIEVNPGAQHTGARNAGAPKRDGIVREVGRGVLDSSGAKPVRWIQKVGSSERKARQLGSMMAFATRASAREHPDLQQYPHPRMQSIAQAVAQHHFHKQELGSVNLAELDQAYGRLPSDSRSIKGSQCLVLVVESLEQLEQAGHSKGLNGEFGRVQKLDGTGTLLGSSEITDQQPYAAGVNHWYLGQIDHNPSLACIQ